MFGKLRRKVETCEFSLRIIGKLVCCACSFLFSVELPDIDPLTVFSAACSPFTIGTCAYVFESRFAVTPNFGVVNIFSLSAIPKIRAAVIESISAAMICLLFVAGFGYDAVHPNTFILSGVTISLIGLSECVAGVRFLHDSRRLPRPLHQVFIINQVNDGMKATRERDESTFDTFDNYSASFRPPWIARAMALKESPRLASYNSMFGVRESSNRSLLSASALAISEFCHGGIISCLG